MSFGTLNSTAVSDKFTVLDQMSNGDIWCSTASGSLALFRSPKQGIDAFSDTAETNIVLLPERVLHPKRPLHFPVTFFKVHSNERQALLGGQIDRRPYLAVGLMPDRARNKGMTEEYNWVSCQGDFIFNISGIILRQIEWWPREGCNSFVVLAGDCLALYNSRPITLLATYRLRLGYDPGYATGFCFANGEDLWDAFTLCVLRDDGLVFALCPIAVPGIKFSVQQVNTIAANSHEPGVKEWLRQVFSKTEMEKVSAGNGTEIETRFLPQMSETAPVLQGPLNEQQFSAQRGFVGIESLGKGLVLLGNLSQVVQVGYLCGVSPCLKEGNRSGNTYVVKPQVCQALRTSARLEIHSTAQKPSSKQASVLQITRSPVYPAISISTESEVTYVDFMDPQRLVTVDSDINREYIGCIWPPGIAANGLYPLQMAIDLLSNTYAVESRSSVLPISLMDPVSGDVDTEESTINRISDLRWKITETNQRINALCTQFGSSSRELLPEINLLLAKIKSFTERASPSVYSGSESKIASGYRQIMNQICDEVSCLEMDTCSTTDKIEAIKRLEARLADSV